ncbi:MAG: hypothetical protein H8E60_11105 [Candidatus Marinimicrobia bacterium]|nr:hypothetical protein [Candidatus Neomarinimicrobiota bacterium]
MEYFEKSLPSLWFDIYKVVLDENERLNGSAMDASALSTITTSIFISVTQRNKHQKPGIFNRFQSEVIKLVARVKDRGTQESIYKSLKIMVKDKI